LPVLVEVGDMMAFKSKVMTRGVDVACGERNPGQSSEQDKVIEGNGRSPGWNTAAFWFRRLGAV